jgi:hypothetical protein
MLLYVLQAVTLNVGYSVYSKKNPDAILKTQAYDKQKDKGKHYQSRGLRFL